MARPARDMKNLSKWLSYVLRHEPHSIGLVLDEGGWALISDLIVKSAAAGRHSPASKSLKRSERAISSVLRCRRATRRQFSAEEKIRIVLDGLRGEDSIAELCRREGIVQNLYYRWSKDFLEAGKKRLAGDTARAATSDEVKELRREASALKEAVADLTLENRLLKKSMIADGGDQE